MGLLDDAIREHLDLKRRHGADPADIERAEREALGPVRRGPEVAAEGLPPDEAAFPVEAGHPGEEELASEALGAEPEPWEPLEEDDELHALEERDEGVPYEPAHGPSGDPLMEDEPLPEAGSHPPPHPAEASPVSDAEPDVAPYPAEPPPASDPSHLEQATEEYEVEHEPETDDDVLETTPEFLQDAPDHDRLWFEQRPPRDFDFDG
jgi:hypothetical protein